MWSASSVLIVIFAFILRLGLGVTAFILLPQAGYESKPNQAGYLFFDAYRRDSQAWDLAQSGKPLWPAQFVSGQVIVRRECRIRFPCS